jgi:hypothetical protein
MTGYTWTVSAGGTVTAGAGTNAITVTWNTAGAQNVTVTYTNASGCAAAAPVQYNVTVNTAPAPTISGPASMCVNSGYYDYVTQTGFTGYTWTISSGGTITWGQGTNQVQVTWNTSGSQWIAVNYTNSNGCSAPAPVQYAVTVNPMPGAAGNITGTAAVCGGAQGVAYSIAPVANAVNYVWNLPAGATIATGFNTNSITVNFDANASSGNITAQGNNLCGNGTPSAPFAVTVTPQAGAAGAITGEAAVCQGTSGVIYTVAPVANATTYTWTVPTGATIVSGATTNSITVDFGLSAASGVITVYGSNSCGNGTTSPDFNVTVNPIPPTPVVTVDEVTLSSDAPAGNQWYFEGNPIPGATGQTYEATLTGWYWCVVTLNGCSSDESNHEYVVITGVGELQTSNFSIFPVPNDGNFTISMTSPVKQVISIVVYNKIGQPVYELRNIEVTGTVQQVIDLRPVASGVYTIVFQGETGTVTRKMIVNR